MRLVIVPCHYVPSAFQSLPFNLHALCYPGWDFLLLMDKMYEYLEGQITSDVSSVLFVGLCKDSIASLMLAIRLHATHPELSVGVFGCAWAGDYTGSTPTYHGQSLSSLHTKIQHQYPYDTLLNQCDPLILLNNPDTTGIKLYGFYCKDPYWNMDELSTDRLRKHLSKVYNPPPSLPPPNQSDHEPSTCAHSQSRATTTTTRNSMDKRDVQ